MFATRCLLSALLLSSCGLSLLRGQNMPPTPVHPPKGHVLVGDMWVPRAALTEDGLWDGPAWTNGVVPYAFEQATVSYSERTAMLMAMAEIEAVCDVSFVPWTAGLNYILIRENPVQNNVSNSEVGMQQFGQILNVGESHWGAHFLLVHELMHALGFKHEHQRIDRNTYVTINWSNINQFGCGGGSCNGNFAQFLGQAIGPYDFESVMHYHRKAFGIGSSDTITCKAPYMHMQNVIGKLDYLSYGDAQGLQVKYGVPGGPVINSHVPTIILTGSGSIEVHVSGSGFLRGSYDSQKGTQGSKVQYLSGATWKDLDTSVKSSTKVVASMTIGESFPTGTLSFRVLNDVLAGGATNVVASTVNAPPCASADEHTGHAVLGLPDIDNDDLGDALVGRPGFNNGRGQVVCRSGADGAVLWTFSGTVSNGNVGYALAAIADMNSDGVPDVLSGAPGLGNGVVHILDGSSGIALRTIDGGSFGSGPGFGKAVSAAGDLDNNGTPDLVVGSPDQASFRGRIDLISGSNGLPFFGIPGLQTGERFGASVGGGHDLNGDGRPEVVVGAPMFDGANGIACGRLAIYEGAFGTSLVGAIGDGPADQLGRAVVIAPSTNGSKLGCVVAGAPEPGNRGTNVGNGYVRQYRYLNGPIFGLLPVSTRTSPVHGRQFGYRVVDAGDVDDDGATDFLISAPGTSSVSAAVELLSGRSGRQLWLTERSASDDRFGWGLAVGIDEAKGHPRAIIGIPYRDGQCPDSGAWTIETMRVSPVADKLMITEVVSGNPPALPAGVELTNFSDSAIDLTDWRVHWHDFWPLGNTGGHSNSMAGIVIQPQETIVLRTQLANSGFAETPPSVRTFAVLNGGSSFGTDFCVGLEAPNGYVIDEVRSAAVGGGYFEGTVGGKFRGVVHNHHNGPFVSPRQIERIWGLDSNSATDWTVGAGRSMGLESQSAGSRDTRSLAFEIEPMKLNEISRGSTTYVELLNRGSNTIDLQGWSLRYSAAQGAAITSVFPFPERYNALAGDLIVVGSTPQPPAELPASGRYQRTNGLSLGASEFTIGLYDEAGRLVDLLRATRANSDIEHNDPRLPSHPDDFRFAAAAPDTSSSLARNTIGSDSNVGADWRPFPIRSMGRPNLQPWTPDPTKEVDVRVNNGPGGAMSIILDAGADHAGEQWGFSTILGHVGARGDSPPFDVLSLGMPQLVGVLGSHGQARVDFDRSVVPVGLTLDFEFVLVDPVNGVTTSSTQVLMYDW